ncbi:N-6 DNA methylase [Nocardiopsis terrae]|uniref:N-6 DNA methylase n=1 Tax=Streptomyces sp. NPDC057554 TaxID=3350538 RepID=UPI0036797E1E
MEQLDLFALAPDLDPAPGPLPLAAAHRERPPLLLPTGTPDQAATALSEAVTAAWHRTHPAGRLSVPLGALAGFALISPPLQEGRTVTELMLTWDTDQIIEFAREQWRILVKVRPDLVNPLAPLLLTWCGDQPLTDKEARGAADVVRAALGADLYALTTEMVRGEVDLFGHTLTLLKAPGARQSQAAVYTPAHMCELMNHIMGAPKEGSRVHDPTLGTGGMLRAAAAAMREADLDPATVTWVGNDIDELAVACAAVNAVHWGLGRNVLFAVADTLTEDWIPRAVAARAETMKIAQQATRMRAMVDAVRKLMGVGEEVEQMS